MEISSIKCHNCGSTVDVDSRFAHSAVCKYCKTMFLLEGDKVESFGTVEIFKTLSFLEVGMDILIENSPAKVKGRIRLEDDEDTWDEWFVLKDNIPIWIEDSYSEFTIYEADIVQAEIPPYEDVRVGTNVTVNGLSLYVTEVGDAEVKGVEGEFTGKVKPSDAYKYMHGVAAGFIYTVEYYPDAIKLLKGYKLKPNQISKA
jgi:hypothetical protein